MARKTLPRPTDTELDILNFLWGNPGKTAREVAEYRSCEYTSAYTLLTIMEKKGWIRRGERQSPVEFFAVANEDSFKGNLLSDFLQRVFGDNTEKLILQALDTKKIDRAQLRKIVEQTED